MIGLEARPREAFALYDHQARWRPPAPARRDAVLTSIRGAAISLVKSSSMEIRPRAAEADRRQQGLFVLVAEAVDPARAFQDPVRGGGDPDGPAGDAGDDAQIRPERKVPFSA